MRKVPGDWNGSRVGSDGTVYGALSLSSLTQRTVNAYKRWQISRGNSQGGTWHPGPARSRLIKLKPNGRLQCYALEELVLLEAGPGSSGEIYTYHEETLPGSTPAASLEHVTIQRFDP